MKLSVHITDFDGEKSAVSFPTIPVEAANIAGFKTNALGFITLSLTPVILGLIYRWGITFRDVKVASSRLRATDPDARRETRAILRATDTEFNEVTITIPGVDPGKQNSANPGVYYKRLPDGSNDPANHSDWNALILLINAACVSPAGNAITVYEAIDAGANV